jgi:hypothetical protein
MARVSTQWQVRLGQFAMAGTLLFSCRIAYVPIGDSGANDDTTDATGASDDTATSDSGSTGDTGIACTEDTALDSECPGDVPYCVDGSCVACDGLPDACAGLDPLAPACDASTGLCAECSVDDTSLCGGTTPVCNNGGCEACTANSQCASGVCVMTSGACQALNVDLQGRVLRFETVAETPVEGASLEIDNLNPVVMFDNTPASGEYNLDQIPAGSLVHIDVDVDEGWVGDTSPAFRTVHELDVGLISPLDRDLELVSYQWLAQVALDCGAYDFGANPTIWDVLCNDGGDGVAEPGCSGPGEGVGTFFLTRSTIVGTLLDVDGTSLYQGSLSKSVMSAIVDNNGTEEANVEGNPNDTDPNPFSVCWLKESGGEYVGGPEDANSTGKFVMFRARNASGLGVGGASVEASGFLNGDALLASTGAAAVVTMQRNDDPITRDFAVDVYPMFQTYGCVNCHNTGGIGAENGERAGFKADWSLSPQEVYDNLVGPGTVCNLTVPIDDPTWGSDPGKSSGRLRICANRSEESLVVIRPVAGLPTVATDVHPIDIFPSADHPQMIAFREWVDQGANPPASVDPIDFAADIHPIFTSRGCVGCHTGCESATPGPGCRLDDATSTFWSNWNEDAMTVFDNLTGPGTNCADPANDPLRVCVNSPEDSLFVVRPLAGVPVNDPHPADIFADTDDPDLDKIIRWIEEGANFTP